MLRPKASVLCLMILIWLHQPAAALANGGPLYYPADGSGLLQFDTSSPVGLAYEKVSFLINGDAESGGRPNAEVSVHYRLHNDSAERRSLDMLFVTPTSSALQVFANGRGTETTTVSEVQLANWTPQGEKTAVTEPVSGKQLDMKRSGWRDIKPAGTRFALTFQPGETLDVTIRYQDHGGMYDKGVVNPVRSHLYYLTPAQFWNGTPQVELEVRLNDSRHKLSSNLPLEHRGGNVYEARLNGLPDSEWYISYASTDGLLFPTNGQIGHNSCILLLSAVMTALVAALSLYWRSRLAYAIGAAAIMAFTVFYIRKIGGYPFNAIFVIAVDILAAAMLLAVYRWISKRLSVRQ